MFKRAALEEAVLLVLCHSSASAVEIASKITPQLFSNKTNKLIAETALTYIAKYGTPPGNALDYQLSEEMDHGGEEGRLLRSTVKLLEDKIEQLSPGFIIDELDNFLKLQQLNKTGADICELTDQGDLDGAQKLLSAVKLSSHGPGKVDGFDGFSSAADYCAREQAEVEFLVPPLIVQRSITLLSGKPKLAGKTAFTLAMVKAIVDGSPFLAEPCVKSPVFT